MNWDCPKCGESITQTLDVCWACGTAKDGTVDPEFLTADSYEPPIAEEKVQYSLANLMTVITVLCLVLAISKGLLDPRPSKFTVILLWGAIGHVLFQLLRWMMMFVVWLIAFPMQRWQRRFRANQNRTGSSEAKRKRLGASLDN